MGVRKNRILAMIIAVVMVLTSAVAVFADVESTTQGTTNANKSSIISMKNPTIVVKKAGGTVKFSVNNGKTWKTAKSSTIKGLKAGQYVNIKTKNGETYRWVKITSITKASRSLLKWKKVSGAKAYLVKVIKGKKVYYKKVKGTSLKASAFKDVKTYKGAKISVRPLTEKNKHVYSGALCKYKVVK